MLFEYQLESSRWTWSQGLYDLHGIPAGAEPTTELMLSRMVEEDRPEMLARFQHHLEHEGPYSCAYRMTDPQGRLRRIMFVGQSEAVAGTIKRLTGFVVDITDPMRNHASEVITAVAEHRAAIEQAKGALMLLFGVEDGAAFDLLKVYSSRYNLKLAVVAERMVAGFTDPAFSRADPVHSLLDIVVTLGTDPPAPDHLDDVGAAAS
jgi:hypothetical protein